MYGESTIYVVGNSKTNSDNAITNQFNSFFIGFVVDVESDTIVDLSCSSTIRTTDEFVRSLFIEKKLLGQNSITEEEIKKRYHGSSQRAIVVAYKDAVKKYIEIKNKYF
ncbi:hypothetical protein BD780_002695 [Clostridium tetanomorphum]|uniref:DUF3870 domain-containing protein n=1 Tax=Clostridium tetanomorphum TaxID=1553 RepID=A0A923E9R1_CLOTT|nr:DUF3870 domain-containing protein [Clostridium tetanomorphum]KAJ50615.1 hypothetical protein CTM_16762 [Clostridium tetanomorphum DSM 665]MBC2399075.1 DUF3870 domain-containing protein [Clostridium tetanomorphum]MBP1862690.1 hypothetical protein [Clostridium tetanomorphum]NRS85470.1 hypothetical protein [Clostridium tetanomorphum]NRZ98584.1 hypothetical protein [Clostridium tetanomorphum]